MNVCGFNEAWVGPCTTPCPVGEQCKKHQRKCLCGNLAIQDCDQEIMSMICGSPLCGNEDCHKLHSKGHREANRSRVTYDLRLHEDELRFLFSVCDNAPPSLKEKLRVQELEMDKWIKRYS